jgi:ATP-dependent DNA helicase RecG
VIDPFAPIDALAGVGPAVAEKCHKLGCQTIIDLAMHLPYRYEDKTRLTPMRDAQVGQWGLFQGQIQSVTPKRHPKQPVRVLLNDNGTLVQVAFFKLFPNQMMGMKVGRWMRCYGNIAATSRSLQLNHPEFMTFDTIPGPALAEQLTPVYHTTQGISAKRMRELVHCAFGHLEPFLIQENQAEHLPIELMPFAQALRAIHFPAPESPIDLESQDHHPAVKRLVFEEHAAYQFALRKARRQMQSFHATPFADAASQEAILMAQLGFDLTSAQKKVWAEIQKDLQCPRPMMRLVQGDVGSGKTVLAALAALMATTNGAQVAVMAPTELLANQLAQQFSKWFDALEIPVALLTSSVKGKKRQTLLKALENGSIPIVVGTHALFQAPIQFARLGLMVVDEQHRFGVEQRLALYQKGEGVHQLVMSATPIPRSLAMSMWADLDVSLVDERPPGRQPITTIVLPTSRKSDVIARVDAAIEAGDQAFWVCTLVNENEKLTQEAAVVAFDNLKSLLPHRKIGCVHGQMPSAEKEQTLQAFRSNDLQVLVSTTVIEVGIDVPQATLMIIENPERLGLSQCHQLRGRVGRGDKPSFCVLLYDPPLSIMAKKRLEILKKTDNGFTIAEEDLKLRGPGEVLGRRQTGARQFKIADICRDKALLEDILALTTHLEAHCPEIVESWAARWHAGEIVLTQV